MKYLKTSARPAARSNRFSSATVTLLVLVLLHCSFIFTATAEIINPQCSKNVCVLPSNECVYSCPRNQKGAYFTFGLRSNNKCAPPSTPGKAFSHTSADLPLIEGAGPDDTVSSKTNQLAERQDLWPEYGPPDCFWGLCQLKGPPCILWCTEDHVYYGDNDGCKDPAAAQNSAPLLAGSPSSLETITVIAVVLVGMGSFVQILD